MRLNAIIDAPERGLVERRQSVRLCLLWVLAGEHILFIGPPAPKRARWRGACTRFFCAACYFERLLTRFSVPEEIFGPLSIFWPPSAPG